MFDFYCWQSTSGQSKAAASNKGKQTTANDKKTKKSKKTVSFAKESCRRSLCFSDEEEQITQNETVNGRPKRVTAKLNDVPKKKNR